MYFKKIIKVSITENKLITQRKPFVYQNFIFVGTESNSRNQIFKMLLVYLK